MARVLRKYSLWLMADAASEKNFQERIRRFSGRHQMVPFKPHLTLISPLNEIDAPAIRSLLQNRRAPILRIMGPRAGKGVFKCVYLLVKPSPPLLRFYREVRQKLGIRETRPFAPHISMAYGRPSPADKTRMVSELRDFSGKTFRVRSLRIIDSSKDVSSWKKVREFKLRRGSPQNSRRRHYPK